MSEPKVLFGVVASNSYWSFAKELERSLRKNVSGNFGVVIFQGVEGWPIGTECRHGIFAGWLEREEYAEWDLAFLLDADMLCEDPFLVDQIVPSTPGIVAVLHPGYVGMPRAMLPYEDRPESRAYMPDSGTEYYCGGVIGGTRKEMIALSRKVAEMIEQERNEGREIRWHDESCVNRILAETPPALILSPAWCHPQGDAYYRESVWGGRDYPRYLTALDKQPELRGNR
jgi:histo-blood group ABO system transferase